ncbi:MAG: aminoacyl-tRNA hydrolase [Acidobacteria bacterium]|nr:aminoacyl-tRNA hydrolase [Acidobacteriota bacterium]
MKLVVGLGNPGAEYRETRHNVGFQVVDELARRWGVDQWRESFEALAAKTAWNGEPVLLSKPLTFMNLSGRSVASLVHFYKVDPADLLVVADDVALPLGRLRARRGGSDGGHNGLRSVAQSLGTQAFPRLRIGVGRGDVQAADGRIVARPDMAGHVLGRFRPDEREAISAAILRAADASELFVAEGIERVMNAFNAGSDAKEARKTDGQQEPDPAS